ncbi:MarR family winged helix-turn-helix transcriptional regulator [Streptomyces sp. NPDC012438]|uniref:MarR family winged helix-turn-helix transcriptional regulator n=1 Tax=Streptomyces sp. NPDC012438 TaxID=3364833 RepID=UPI0036E883B4
MELPTGSTTDQAPADPAATDDVLATQPVGYWCGLTQTAVTRHLRDAMAKIDVTQPQYWVLNRVNGGLTAPSREETIAQLTHLADGPHEIARVVDQLLHREWLRINDGQRLHLTNAGEAARARLRELATEVRAVVHRGISDEEYVAALKVLRKMVANVGGDGTSGHPF